MNDTLRMRLPLTSLPPATADEVMRADQIRQEKMANINVDPFPVPLAFQGFHSGRMELGDYPQALTNPVDMPDALRYALRFSQR